MAKVTETDLIVLCRKMKDTGVVEYYVGERDIIEDFHDPDSWEDEIGNCRPTMMYSHLKSNLTMLSLIYSEYEFPICKISFRKRDTDDNQDTTLADPICTDTD